MGKKEIKGHLKTLLGNYKHAIGIWDDAIPHELCDSMLEYFEKGESFESMTSGSKVRKHVRNSLEVNVTENTAEVDAIYDIIGEACLQYLDNYKPFLKTFGATNWEQLTVLKYPEGDGYYEWHTDSDTVGWKPPRILSVIIYLNDVEEGGATEFKFFDDIKVKPKKGRMAMFPSGWIHHHRGAKPIKGDKSILVTWLQKMPMPEGVEITRAE